MFDWEIIRTILAVGVPTGLCFIGIMVGAFWKIVAMIRRLETEQDDSAKELHSRINRVRDEMVHKSDMDKWQDAFSTELKDTRREVREAVNMTNMRLDEIMKMLANSHKTGSQQS